MKRTMDEKRLKAIKTEFPIFYRKCDRCGSEFKFENMFTVYRWGLNKSIHKWSYCTHCTPTKEDVLKDIYKGSCSFGIAYVDKF